MSIFERIPARIRFALYVVYLLAGPILIYTSAKGWTGQDEWVLYAGIGSAFGLTAASNVNLRTRQRVPAGIKQEPL